MALTLLKFEPYLKEVLWGGTRIEQFKGLKPTGQSIGESWELSPMPGHESVIASGELKGKTLCEALRLKGKEIMGERLFARYGDKFPLLIKFIDSNDDLSIQVHPDDALAKQRHNSLGKTEMWYSINPTEGAYLYAGMKREISKDEYQKMVKESTIVEALGKYFTKKGDVFFLPAGRIHSIGRGNFVVEIQQASDITYRIFDYNRKDKDGKERTLHVAESLDAVHLGDTDMQVANIEPKDGVETLLQKCQYFTTTIVGVNGRVCMDLRPRDSFTILIAIEGSLTVRDSNGEVTEIRQGETTLVPQALDYIDIEGCGKLVTSFV